MRWLLLLALALPLSAARAQDAAQSETEALDAATQAAVAVTENDTTIPSVERPAKPPAVAVAISRDTPPAPRSSTNSGPTSCSPSTSAPP